MKKNLVLTLTIIFTFSVALLANQADWDETGFFRTDPPKLTIRQSSWTVSNSAISLTIRYQQAKGALLITQIQNLRLKSKLLNNPSPLLVLTDRENQTLLDLSQGWDLINPPSELSTRSDSRGSGTMGLDFTLRPRKPVSFAAGPVEVTIKVNFFSGDEPYVTFESLLNGQFKPKSHVLTVQYANLYISNPQSPRPFGRYSNHHTIPTGNGNAGMWVSIANYNPTIKSENNAVSVKAEANIYLDEYLPLTNGSLGTWFLGTYTGPVQAALYDYQLFLIKHWVAGNNRTIPPHYHDYWYETRKGVTEPQPPRFDSIAPIIKQCGFHFFWFIYDKHGVWPDWRPTPEQFFPGGLDANDPNSIAAVMKKHNLPLGLYTAPCRLGLPMNFHLRHKDCQTYGDLLGQTAKKALAPVWWYEDNPGENYSIQQNLPNQQKGNCSWMWQQGYMITRNAARKWSKNLSFARTRVAPAEQLGWAEACSCLDVYGDKTKGKGNQSGGTYLAYDLSLADRWRNTVWQLVPVWPLMNHIAHHPVHIRDANAMPSHSEYIDSSAAMIGPFVLNGPIQLTTSTEREIHRKWAQFNWDNRDFLQFSYKPEIISDCNQVDGICHLKNPDPNGLCGFIGLWNKDDNKPVQVTLAVDLPVLRLRYSRNLHAKTLDENLDLPLKQKKNRLIIGPVEILPRTSKILKLSDKPANM